MKFIDLYKVIMESGLIIYEYGAKEASFDSISGYLTSYTDEEWNEMVNFYYDWTVIEVQGIENGLVITLRPS